jgi:hypothetical protein
MARYVQLNIIEIIITEPKIFTKTRIQGNFRVCDLSPCNYLAETNIFCLGTILLPCIFFELHKPFSSALEPRSVFSSAMAFVPVIASSKHFQWWCRSSVTLSCQAEGIILAEIEFRTYFSGFQPPPPPRLLFQVSRSKHAKFGANR